MCGIIGEFSGPERAETCDGLVRLQYVTPKTHGSASPPSVLFVGMSLSACIPSEIIVPGGQGFLVRLLFFPMCCFQAFHAWFVEIALWSRLE